MVACICALWTVRTSGIPVAVAPSAGRSKAARIATVHAAARVGVMLIQRLLSSRSLPPGSTGRRLDRIEVGPALGRRGRGARDEPFNRRETLVAEVDAELVDIQ